MSMPDNIRFRQVSVPALVAKRFVVLLAWARRRSHSRAASHRVSGACSLTISAPHVRPRAPAASRRGDQPGERALHSLFSHEGSLPVRAETRIVARLGAPFGA
jgi:hypothetical protein